MKRISNIVAALAMTASPIIAAPAFAAPTNPAAQLSVAKSVRSGTPASHKNALAGGGGILAILIVAGVVAIGVIAVTKDDDADSN